MPDAWAGKVYVIRGATRERRVAALLFALYWWGRRIRHFNDSIVLLTTGGDAAAKRIVAYIGRWLVYTGLSLQATRQQDHVLVWNPDAPISEDAEPVTVLFMCEMPSAQSPLRARWARTVQNGNFAQAYVVDRPG